MACSWVVDRFDRAPIPPSTGHHSKHQRERVSCASCHGPGYGSTTVNAATHRNGIKELLASTGWTAATRSCKNSCHEKETW